MPEQRPAAEEHGILEEITAPQTRLPDDLVRVAAEVDFPVALRGYDRIAVDAYVKRMSRLVAELDSTRSPEGPVQRALERVGEQISGVLERARDTAEQITTQARLEAVDRLEVARLQAEQIVSEAARRVDEFVVEAERITGERARLVDDARGLARELTTLVDAAAKRFPPDEPEAKLRSEVPESQALEPEHADPGLDAESQAVAGLWAAAAGQAPERDPGALPPPDGPAGR